MNAADALKAAGVRSTDTLTPPKERRTVLNQEDFMTLLSTQLKYQDPSKPMEANEMVAQMAQLSMVTGVADIKKALTDLSGSLASSRTAQATQLVGREVLLDGGSTLLPWAARSRARSTCRPMRRISRSASTTAPAAWYGRSRWGRSRPAW